MDNLILRAILSLDSYNRGYGAGVNLSGAKVGNYSIGADSGNLTFLGRNI